MGYGACLCSCSSNAASCSPLTRGSTMSANRTVYASASTAGCMSIALNSRSHSPMNSDSEEDEEGDGTSYCGRAGCRDYPHEHVAWKEKKPAEKRIVPRELRQI